MNISVITSKVAAIATKSAFKIKANSPKILLAVGVVGIVGGVIIACKQSVKVPEILDEHNDMVERINEVHESGEMNDSEYRKNLFTQYSHTGVRFIKLYGPATAILLLSLASILYSHGIISKRNLELLAAYKALEESYSTYRKRVKERFGEEADYNAAIIDKFTGEDCEIEKTDGSKAIGEKVVMSTKASPYAKFFDEYNTNWQKDPSMNMFFLKAQQKFANDKFDAQGFLFLNDVYDALGFPKTSAGQLVGWFKGQGDDFIDFGIFDGDNEKKRDFVNCLERAILLDFNVDGVIYDLI